MESAIARNLAIAGVAALILAAAPTARAQSFETFCGAYGPGSTYYQDLSDGIRGALRAFDFAEARSRVSERRGLASCCRRIASVRQRSCLCNNPTVPSGSRPDDCLVPAGG